MASRVATTIKPAIDRRLRVLAALQGKPLGHVLNEQLDKVLPSDDELASLVRSPQAVTA